VDLRDGIGEEEPADGTVGRMGELSLVIGRSGEADESTRRLFGVPQVVQPSDNLELPFGSVASNSS
jgi:hypothetical protein